MHSAYAFSPSFTRDFSREWAMNVFQLVGRAWTGMLRDARKMCRHCVFNTHIRITHDMHTQVLSASCSSSLCLQTFVYRKPRNGRGDLLWQSLFKKKRRKTRKIIAEWGEKKELIKEKYTNAKPRNHFRWHRHSARGGWREMRRGEGRENCRE